VQEILAAQKNQVYIEGNVNAPGSYALDVFKDLKTLINQGAKGVLPNTYMQKLDINKVDNKGNLSFKTFNLSSVLDDKIKVSLQENDTIKIYALEEVQGAQTVTISGFVEKPKTIFWSKNLSVFDLVFQAVSYEELDFQSKVLRSRLDLKRVDKQTGSYNLTQYSLDELEEIKTTYLMPDDEVLLYTKSVSQDVEPSLKVLGAVVSPGEFRLGNTLYVEDAILMAGGFLEEAEKTVVNVNRLDRDLDKGTYSKLETYQLDMEYLLGIKNKPSNPFVLENKDIITVFAPIRARFQPTITVQGEVKFPRTIILENDQIGVKKIIEIAGGLTNNSNLESSYIVRDSLKVFFNVKKYKSNEQVALLDGDVLVIGSKLASVSTSGGIVNPSIFNWEKGRRAKYYIANSGGTKKRIAQMYVQQANGISEKIGFLKNPMVYPGAEIVVVEKPEKIPGEGGQFLDDFVKIFGILSGTLTTVILTTRL
jgi:protein involved in polysaccharide export with SLBB domain